jgi:hypothetical protein
VHRQNRHPARQHTGVGGVPGMPHGSIMPDDGTGVSRRPG